MSTFLLVRHGFCASVGDHISGRKKGVHLDDKGILQVKRLSEELRTVPIDRIYSSPLERTIETAELIGHPRNVDISTDENLNEIQYGDWTGLTFSQLEKDPRWKQFNLYRGKTRIPGGEMMLEVVSRMSSFIERVRRECSGVILVVSHGDPIKAVLAHYCGVPLDYILHFDVSPASVSSLVIDDYGAEVLCINKTTDIRMSK
ncbi:MAG: histidine phosphatase family protein [Fibrobacter sp.]|nr:histidine phosphatase family protein [Fibrobacter sp.]